MSSSGPIDAAAAAAANAVHSAAVSAAEAVAASASAAAAAAANGGAGGKIICDNNDVEEDDDEEEEEEEEAAEGLRAADGKRKKMGRPKPGAIVLKFVAAGERERHYWLAVNDSACGDFLVHTADRLGRFMASERLYCIYCKKSQQLVAVANLRSHADGKKHKQQRDAVKADEARRARNESGLGVIRSSAAGALVPHAVGVRARMFAHAMLLAEGLNPAQVTRVMSPDVLEMLSFARLYHEGAGIAGMMRSEAVLAERIIIKHVTDIFANPTMFFTLCDDGGSSKLERGKSIHALLVSCAELPKVVLLKMIVLGNDDGAAPALAKRIKEVLGQYKLVDKLTTQCVGVMGDNAAISNAVSRELGLGEQQHCLAHAIALLIMAALKRMPTVKKFLVALHAFFTAGGNKSRRNEAMETVYVEAGFVIGPVLALYLNRWGTVHPLVKALLVNNAKMVRVGLPKFFDEARSVAAFKASEASVAEKVAAVEDLAPLDIEKEMTELEMVDDDVAELLADLGDGGGDGDGDLGESTPAARKAAIRRNLRVPSAALKAILEGLADPNLVPELALFDALTESLAPLIAAASADYEEERAPGYEGRQRLSYDVISDILELPEAYEMMKNDAENFMSVAESRAGLRDGETFAEPLRTQLGRTGVAAASLMLTKTKHIQAYAANLKRKLLWDHRCSEFKEAIMPSDKLRAKAAYFGLPEPPSALWLAGFNKWVRGLKDLTKAQRAMSPAKYWRSLATTMPSHYTYGLWYANILMGNVAAERAIALMRLVETPLRNRIEEEAWQAEMCLRRNKWLVSNEFAKILVDVKAVKAAEIQTGTVGGAKRPRAAATADDD